MPYLASTNALKQEKLDGIVDKFRFIIWLHFVGDFILQSDEMALNKSRSLRWLSFHAATYSIPLFLVGWKFALANAGAHWLVDLVTSRINSQLWAAGKRHWFFVGIGFDQAVHLSILFYSYGAMR